MGQQQVSTHFEQNGVLGIAPGLSPVPTQASWWPGCSLHSRGAVSAPRGLVSPTHHMPQD